MKSFLADEEVYTERYNICKQCPKFNKYLGICKACGCIMRVKTKLPGMKCPEGQWKR